MHDSSVGTQGKYEIGDLSKFFKKISKDISKVFSNNMIRSAPFAQEALKTIRKNFHLI